MHENLKSEGDINLSPERKMWTENLPHETKEILNADSGVFIHQALSTPCLNVLSGSAGPYLITHTGEKILDFHGNNLHQIGYGNPAIINAIINELHTLPFSPRRFTNLKAIELAERLTQIAPPELSRVLFAPGGAAVNSMALKLARLVTGKHKVVSMWGSFHGSTIDTISVGGESVFRSGIGPLMSGAIQVPQPSQYRSLWKNDPDHAQYLNFLRSTFEQEGDIGAFIAETVRNTDVQIPAFHFWQKVRELCDEFGILLILDEIPTWMGRTGKYFTFEHYGIVPDMVTIGKALGGGVFPLAALITKEKFNNVPEHSIGHFTHEKSSVGCAAGLAALNFIEENAVLGHVAKMEAICKKRLTQLQQQFQIIGDVRGIGLLWGIELVSDQHTKSKASSEAEKIMYTCLQKGLSFKVSSGNVITLAPSLIITEEQLNEAFDILDEAFGDVLC